MTKRKQLFLGLAFVAACSLQLPAVAAEPTLHQVYQAADAGRTGEALGMMREVLQAHPESAKAHYVEAELLAKEGRLPQAEAELATAERLAPGLPFAKPVAVAELKTRLVHPAAARPATTRPVQAYPAAVAETPAAGGVSWGLLFVILGVIVFIVWAARFMGRRASPVVMPGGGGYAGNTGMTMSPGYGPGPYPNAPYGAPPAGGGMGSGILGSLATGAAVGAGVVAGEALMHRMIDGRGETMMPGSRPVIGDLGPGDSYADDNLGGSDFGVSDAGSWDDGGGSSDWT